MRWSKWEEASELPIEICMIDHRGCGGSYTPRHHRDYSIDILARDAALVLVRAVAVGVVFHVYIQSTAHVPISVSISRF
jgi:pimeloyl-ACP methyl ester carboxylesterase